MAKETQILHNSYNCKVKTLSDEFLINANYMYTHNIHHWNGWICNAGIDSIYINDATDVFIATCQQDLIGNLNNIMNHKSSLNLPTAPTLCKKNVCSACDIMLQLTKFDPDHCVNCD